MGAIGRAFGSIRLPAVTLALFTFLSGISHCAADADVSSVRYKKFNTFFELLDQSGDLAAEYASVNGNLCNMDGVTCSGPAAVVSINFSGRGYTGELVKDNYVYEDLKNLKNLDLSNNNLGYGVAPIPNDLAKLASVEYLDLSNNDFTGELPTFTIDDDDSSFQQLKHIDLSNNELRGRLRWNWSALQDVTYISLAGNNLSGDLPASWSSDDALSNVETLDLSANRGDFCGDDDAAATALRGRGVAVGCKANGSDALTAGVVPDLIVPDAATIQPLLDATGTPITDSAGNAIYIGPTGAPLVDENGLSIIGPSGTLISDVNGNEVALTPAGAAVLDDEGNPVFLGSDGEPLVDMEGTSIVGPTGNLTSDVNGNPVQVGPDGFPVTDADGDPVFLGPNGEPLVDAGGNSIVGPDGTLVSDRNGNPVQTDASGAPVLDAAGNPIFVGPDGQPLVDDAGLSVVGTDGTRIVDVAGNPVLRDNAGNPVLDSNGNPIFVGPTGDPLVDSEGNSVVGPDGVPLTSADGDELIATNGTHIFAADGTDVRSVGGELVFGADGQPLLDGDGNPLALAPEGANPGVAGDAFARSVTLPNGDLARSLPIPSCPFAASPTCSNDSATAVCIREDQLTPGDGSGVAYFHRYFPGVTLESMAEDEPNILDTISRSAGGKPATVVEWQVVEEGEARRKLMQSVEGVRGFFSVVGGLPEDVVAIVENFAALDKEYNNGKQGIGVLQGSRELACGQTNTAGLWAVGILAGVLFALLVGLCIMLFTMRHHYIKALESNTHHLSSPHDHSTATITPTARTHYSDNSFRDPPSKGPKTYAPGSFGSTINGGAFENASDSPSSASGDHGGGGGGSSQVSFGGGRSNGITLAYGLGTGARRSGKLDNQGSSDRGDLSHVLDALSAANLSNLGPVGDNSRSSPESEDGDSSSAAAAPLPAPGSYAANVRPTFDSAHGVPLPPIAEHASNNDTIDSTMLAASPSRGAGGKTDSLMQSDSRFDSVDVSGGPRGTPAQAPPSFKDGVSDNSLNTASITSWDSGMSALMSMRDIQADRSHSTTGSRTPASVGAAGQGTSAGERSLSSAADPSLASGGAMSSNPNATQPESTPDSSSLGAAVQVLGAMGASSSIAGSSSYSAPPPKTLPPKFRSFKGQQIPLQTSLSQSNNPKAPALSPPVSGNLFAGPASWVLSDANLELMSDMPPDQHTEIVGFNTTGMLDSYSLSPIPSPHRRDDPSPPMSTTDNYFQAHPREGEPEPRRVPRSGGSGSGSGPLMPSLIRPAPEGHHASGVFHQAYAMLDSMNPPPEQSLPTDGALDTAAMLTVPQRPLREGHSTEMTLPDLGPDSWENVIGPPEGASPVSSSTPGSGSSGHKRKVLSGSNSAEKSHGLLVPASLEDMLKSQREDGTQV